MFRLFLKTMFRLGGWKIDESRMMLKDVRKCIIASAPHTSNWDFIYTLAAFEKLNMPVRFTIKKEWLRFPFNLIMKPLGAIPIDIRARLGKRRTMVDAMIDLFKENEELIILITPEGTRDKATRWRDGYYKVAMGADIPILIGYLNYENKTGGLHGIVHPTGDYNKDMRPVMDFYKTVKPKRPELFSVDERVYKE